MFCPQCGAKNDEGAKFCQSCGAELGRSAEPSSPQPPIPPAAPASVPPRSLNVRPVEYAGFWRRVVAIAIDAVVLWLVFVPAILIWFLDIIRFCIGLECFDCNSFDVYDGFIIAKLVFRVFLFFLFGTILKWLYFALMESSSHQGTLGKMAIGIVVTDLQGRRVSFARATGRYFGKYISNLILNIGFLMAAFTEKKQALHDIMAGTLVVQK